MQKQIDPQIYEDGDKLPNFRAILLGDARVGKTSLITRFLNNSYKDTYTPTTDIIITKNLINFNPDADRVNDFAYIELIDTIGYDKGSNFDEYKDFFRKLPLVDDILRISGISHRIKHDYQVKEESERKVISLMAYVFVFDFNDHKTFKSMIKLAEDIISQESKDDGRPDTVKIFVGNKCPFLIDSEIRSTQFMIKEDRLNDNAREGYEDEVEYFLDKIASEFDKANSKDGVKVDGMENAKKSLFITNCKHNIGVRKVFEMIGINLLPKEALWKFQKYEEIKKQILDDDDVPADYGNDVSLFKLIFCCGYSQAKNENNEKINESINNQIKDKDEEMLNIQMRNYDSKDTNELWPQDNQSRLSIDTKIPVELNDVPKEEDKKSRCFIL